MGYKLLGIIVWRGGKWFLARRYGNLIAPRRAGAAGLVAVSVAALLLIGRRATAD